MDIGNIGIVLILGGLVMSLLPVSPFAGISSIIASNDVIRTAAYFLPLQECVVTLEAYLVAVSSFYAIKIVGRWIKLIGD